MDFPEEDENASVQINGTIHDFHQEQEDGMVIVDDLHVDGVITGDAQGTFGVVRTIEDTTTQANETGTMFDVIIVHQEDWFNITGIAALPNSDLGAGAHYNESWSYDAKQAHWDNRTIEPFGVKPALTQVAGTKSIQTLQSKIHLRHQQLRRALVISASAGKQDSHPSMR